MKREGTIRLWIGVCVLVAAITATACRAGPDQELSIEFSPLCKDQEIWLSVTIRNTGSQSLRIENGVLPWQYDPVGTSFEVESAGRKLSRNPAIPLIGRSGPIDLQPQQQLSGETPIGFMFPEIAALLEKQPITVHWMYWTVPGAEGANRMKGAVTLSRNPCSR